MEIRKTKNWHDGPLQFEKEYYEKQKRKFLESISKDTLDFYDNYNESIDRSVNRQLFFFMFKIKIEIFLSKVKKLIFFWK